MKDCEVFFHSRIAELFEQWKEGEHAKKENERPAANESAQTPKGNTYVITRRKAS